MGIFDASVMDNPRFSLDDALDIAAMDYEDDFADYWGLQKDSPPEYIEVEDWRALVELYQLARKFAIGASTLVRPPSIRGDQLALPAWLGEEAERMEKSVDDLLEEAKSIVSEDVWWHLWNALSPRHPTDPRTKRAFFDNCMQLEAFRRYDTSPAGMANRMLRLLGVMIRQPGERARAYLSRVAECYIRDMKTEFAVMARAVLDVAIQEIVLDDDIRESVGTRRARRPDLERRIEACRAKDVFDDNVYAAATRVRERGNDAAHISPGLEGKIDDALDDLALCLRALEAAKKR